jgi:hypothetical protein
MKLYKYSLIVLSLAVLSCHSRNNSYYSSTGDTSAAVNAVGTSADTLQTPNSLSGGENLSSGMDNVIRQDSFTGNRPEPVDNTRNKKGSRKY